jgi:hypothetical protein
VVAKRYLTTSHWKLLCVGSNPVTRSTSTSPISSLPEFTVGVADISAVDVSTLQQHQVSREC